MTITSFAFALFAVMSLSPAAHPGPAQAVRFKGSITSSSAEKLIPLLNSQAVGTLVINSFGGSESAALDIATVVKSRKLTVVVDGVCMSACAQYILANASVRQIRPGSLVAFHTSAYAIHEWSSRYAAKDGDYRSLADDSALLKERTANLAPDDAAQVMLLGAFSMLKPLCVAPRIGLSPRIKLAAAFVIPTRDALLRLGMAPPPGWPDSIAEAAIYIRPHVRAGTPFVIGDPFEARTLPPMVGKCP